MKIIIILSLTFILSACSSLSNLVPPDITTAIKIEESETFKELKSLPKPKGAIPVSVYSFRD